MLRRSIIQTLLFGAVWTAAGVPSGFAQSPDDKSPSDKAASANQVEIVRQLARQRGGQPAALAQVIQFSRGMEDDVAAQLIDELAQAHVRAGQLDLAATTRQALVERYPNQPLAADAILWLVRLYASSEVAYAHGGAARSQQKPSPKLAAALEALKPAAAGVADASTSPANSQDPLAVYALHVASQAVAQNGALSGNPAFAFIRSVAARKTGQAKSAAAFLSPLKHRQAGDPWGDCARAEAWLSESRRGAPPKSTTRCAAATAPPRLDGVLDESYWQDQRIDSSVQLAATTTEPPLAKAYWAYDSENLYVAIECPKLPDVAYERDDRPRPRDGDVETHDRMRLFIDVDRDYASCFELTVDSRGWTADRCWGDAAWNPEWFVAAAEGVGATSWIIEAAIPWTQLAKQPPHAGEVWACAAQQFAPGAPSPETANPAPFALLLFD